MNASASAQSSLPVPAIPPCRLSADWLYAFDLLLWTRTGTAYVSTADSHMYRIPAGEGIWLQAGCGATVTTEAGTVAFPYLVTPNTTPDAPRTTLTFGVPAHWQDWLILHFLHCSTGHGIFGYRAAGLGDILGLGDALGLGETGEKSGALPGEEPPLPRASAARRVAEELRAAPAIDRSITGWARLTASSASTIRRGFLDIGWTFNRWRIATRLAAACEHLASGHAVEATAMRVGFTSRHGFTRAFGRHYGLTPSAYASRMSVHSLGSLLRTEAATGTAALAATIARLTKTPAAASVPRPLPATRTSWHRNDVHVLAWLYKGTGDLSLESRHHLRREGEAVWIPAGVAHQAGNDEGSVTLPIGYLSPEDVHISEPMRARFSPEWNDFLLHRAVATRTELRPEGFEPRDMLDLFVDQLANQRSRTVAMPADPRAAAVARHFLTRMKLPAGAGIDAEVHRAFRVETGMTLAQWQHSARMHAARDLLEAGARPTDAARRVGYTRVRSFSRAFRDRYGHPPREHLSRRS
ncbi:helix-turn-helix domain-containing protein [Brevibacterium oceani]|uniref:helix-turn-helix domain-containing protein n=1 Tax=Brevibacterium oceani TaxID=358099 RepID=UPI0015E6F8B0|nr:helix-turn-helix domain-containing protein [Brevibacterium oceani]